MSDDGDAVRREALRRSVVVDTGVPHASESSVTETAEAATEENATVNHVVSVPTAGMAVAARKANATIFVSIDHTSPANKRGVEVLEKLADAVRGSNDLFADADERLAVSTEVQGLRAIMSGTKVRVAAVLSAIKDNGVIAFLARRVPMPQYATLPKRLLSGCGP